MYECACSLQPGDDDPFFSCPIENWHLTADNMYETLKKGAMLYGFNEQRFAPHSLRIAGASAMRSVPKVHTTVNKGVSTVNHSNIELHCV